MYLFLLLKLMMDTHYGVSHDQNNAKMIEPRLSKIKMCIEEGKKIALIK